MLNIACVCKPVVNVLNRAKSNCCHTRNDPFMETQLLYGEQVFLQKEKDGFYLVSIPDQAIYSLDQGWSNYCGWVLKEDIQMTESTGSHPYRCSDYHIKKCSQVIEPEVYVKELNSNILYGTHLHVIQSDRYVSKILLLNRSTAIIENKYLQKRGLFKKDSFRKTLVSYAKKFLKMPYLWGGRSFYCKSSRNVTGVDCSGLIHLLYRQIGLSIPRNAHDQFLLTKECSFSSLLPGDLIFSSEKGVDGRIDHVMLFTEDETLIEATASFGYVRQMTGKKRFGKKISSLQNKECINGFTVFAGKLLT